MCKVRQIELNPQGSGYEVSIKLSDYEYLREKEADAIALQSSLEAKDQELSKYKTIFRVPNPEEVEFIEVAGQRFVPESQLKASREREKILKDALKECDRLFSEIRNDWTDPRSECREGWDIIKKALTPKGEQ